MKLYLTKRSGFTLVEIMVVVAIIGLLAAMAIPNFVKARTISQKNVCIANLKQISGAKTTWALEIHKASTDTPLRSEIWGSFTAYLRDTPSCPGGGIYTIGTVSEKPICTLAAADGHTL